MGGPKTRITQESFDAAVKENQEEFGMEAEEALQSAMEEFRLQGVDLSNIATNPTEGKQAVDAMKKAVEALKVASQTTGDQSSSPSLLKSILHIQDQIQAAAPDSLPLILEAANQADAVPALLTSIKAASNKKDVILPSLSVLQSLLSIDASKDAFMRANGAAELQHLAQTATGDAQLIEHVALVAEAAAKKHEDNKCSLVDSGCASQLVEGLRSGAVSSSLAAVKAVCGCLRSLTTADDPRPAASRAFQNSRTLAQQGAPLLLLSILKQGDITEPVTVAAVCGAAKKLAANEEICKELADDGAVKVTMEVLTSGLGNATLVRSACSLLRQLANSDAIKAEIVDAGGLELLCRAVDAHSTHAGAMEQALGLLVALTLRNPSAATRAVEVGCIDTVLEVMNVCQTGVHGKLGQWVQRQACMSIRNVVARNPELRPMVLDKHMGSSSMQNSGQRYSNSRGAGDESWNGIGANGQGVDGGNLSDQSGQDGGRYESGGGHMTGHVPPVGVVAAQPPSESWGQTGGGDQPDASGMQVQEQQQSQAQGQNQGQGQGQIQGQRQGLGQDQGEGQGHNSGWGQGQRQPEQEGQKQGSGPGQTHGQGLNSKEDFEPKVAYPKGEVYGYRMALWLEHLGGKYDPVYDQPHSLACVKRVNYLAEQNWLQFSGKEDCDMTGHLITFPIIVDRSGAVSARTVNGQFEDIENSIKGKKQPIPAIFLN